MHFAHLSDLLARQRLYRRQLTRHQLISLDTRLHGLSRTYTVGEARKTFWKA